MNRVLALASAMASVSFGVHTFVGERYAARPLLAATDLPRAAVWLNHLTWHIVSVHLFVFAAVLACGAVGLVGRDVVLLVGILAACVSVTSVAVTIRAGIAPHRFPASYLLATTAALAFWGSWS